MTALQNPARGTVGSVADGLRVRPSSSAGPARVDQHAHACLSRELLDVLRLVAVTGSIANVLATGNRQELRAALAVYLPPTPKIFLGLVCQIIPAASFPAALISNMTGFYALLAFAAGATTAHVAPLEPGRGARMIGNDTLVEAWQTAAAQGIALLDEFAACAPATDTDEDPALTRVADVLRGVTLGRWPCVRIDGAVIVPGWVERRSQMRREVSIPAQLQVNGAQQRITLRDISAGGLGIEGGSALQAGDKVNIKLDSGAEVQGVTMWSSKGRAGVRLDTASRHTIGTE